MPKIESPKTSKPAVLYVRFSESRQKNGDSINRQTKNAQAYCQSHGLAIVRTVTDKGKSAYHGLHVSNGELGKFLAEVDSGAYENHIFLIEEVDRLSREGNKTASDLQLRLFAGEMEIHEFKTGMILTGPDDLDSLDKGLVSTLRHSLAKDNSRKLSARLLNVRNSEREQAALDGLAFTSRCPAWLSARIGAKPVEIPEYCDTVRYVFDLAGQGHGAKTIVRKLVAEKRQFFTEKGNWSPEYVTRLLQNRATLGQYQPHKVRLEKRSNGKQVHVRIPVGKPIEMYPAVVTMVQWEAARAAVDSRNRNLGKPVGIRTDKVNSLLTPLVFDADNKCIMNYYRKHGDHPYLVSKWQPKIKSHYLRHDHFETAFLGFLADLNWEAVARESESPEVKAAQAKLNEVLKEIGRINQRLADLQKQVDEGYFSRSLFETLDREKLKLTDASNRREKLVRTVEQTRRQTQALYSPEDLLEAIRSGNPQLRLKLRDEISQRVSRIDVFFDRQKKYPLAWVRFINGAQRRVVLQDDGAGLLWMGDQINK